MSDNEKTTLESVLRKRLEDPRAMIGALDVNAGRLFLTFGDVGPAPRVILHIEGDVVKTIYPESFDDAPYTEPAPEAPEVPVAEEEPSDPATAKSKGKKSAAAETPAEGDGQGGSE